MHSLNDDLGSPVKNVIFDLGNVLLSFKPQDYFAQIYSDDETLSAVRSIFGSKEWQLLDMGSVTREEAIVSLKKKLLGRKDKIVEEAFAALPRILMPILSSVELLERLSKSGYGLFILSNFHTEAFQEMKRMHRFIHFFHGEIISAEVHQVKPDKEIYQLLCAKYSLSPQECLFIDDLKENIEAAKLLGFKTIHFIDDTQLSEELVRYGIKFQDE